jgi:hypothetical protein
MPDDPITPPPVSDPVPAKITATVETTAELRVINPVHRNVETFGFAVGTFLVLCFGLVEVLHKAGVRLGPGEPDHGFPWGTMIMATILIVPKVLGRATAGKLIQTISGRT